MALLGGVPKRWCLEGQHKSSSVIGHRAAARYGSTRNTPKAKMRCEVPSAPSLNSHIRFLRRV